MLTVACCSCLIDFSTIFAAKLCDANSKDGKVRPGYMPRSIALRKDSVEIVKVFFENKGQTKYRKHYSEEYK